ncbi:MAG: hypothetical protein MUE72_06765 [Chitinophagaceae bacterium]|nr:hypothetical protein [Chitinophagaceae bacterium]
MKTVILMVLFTTGTANVLFAQTRNFYYAKPFSETLFAEPKPGTSNAIFNFYSPTIKGSGIIYFEMSSIYQLNYLPNLDSILLIVKQAIKPIQDSLKEDGYVRRADFVFNNNSSPRIRIVTHDERPSNYTYVKNEFVQLKVDMDTVRIKLTTKTGAKLKIFKNGKAEMVEANAPFIIMFTLNNIANIENTNESILNKYVAIIKQSTNEYLVNDTKSNRTAIYSATFNSDENKMISPSKLKWIKNSWNNTSELVPNFYTSFQYALGTFVPSMGVGLRYTFANRKYSTRRLFAMWEPHFFFSRDINNKLVTDRNDFVTLRYTELETKRKDGFDYLGNVSLGFLVNQRGNWFEKNTIKLGLPGVRSGWLQVEPELFFTGILKQVSPSLKITLHYE